MQSKSVDVKRRGGNSRVSVNLIVRRWCAVAFLHGRLISAAVSPSQKHRD
jgi:hypothetical protein